MKIIGLKKAIGDYNRANNGGYYSPRYGYLMFDISDNTIWCDEFYSLGHNSWKEYHSDTIINLDRIMSERGIKITMKNVKSFIEENYDILL